MDVVWVSFNAKSRMNAQRLDVKCLCIAFQIIGIQGIPCQPVFLIPLRCAPLDFPFFREAHLATLLFALMCITALCLSAFSSPSLENSGLGIGSCVSLLLELVVGGGADSGVIGFPGLMFTGAGAGTILPLIEPTLFVLATL